MKYILLIAISFIFFGCSVKEVQPWEKETLAKDTMQEGGGNSLFKKFTSHIYFSKEASKGGGGVAGGGCGCN
jgi:hypothetical protein